MSFFSDYLKKQNRMYEGLELNRLIKRLNEGSLEQLKEKINEDNYQVTSIEDGEDMYTPLEYAIKVGNVVSVKYFIELGAKVYGVRDLPFLCKDIDNVELIELLMEHDVDFNDFRYDLDKINVDLSELPETVLNYYKDKCDNGHSLGFYNYAVLLHNNAFKLRFLKEIERLEIFPREDDFLTPLEASVIGINKANVTGHFVNPKERLETMLSIAIHFKRPAKITKKLIELFVDDYNVDLTNKGLSGQSLMDEIIENYNIYNSVVMSYAFARLKSYEGYEDKILESFDKMFIKMDFPRFVVPADQKLYMSESFEEIVEHLKQHPKLDRRTLHFLAFECNVSITQKAELIDMFVALGGDINCIYDVSEPYYKRLLKEIPDLANCNLLYSVVSNIGNISDVEKLVPTLLKYEAKIEQNQQSALLRAIQIGNVELVKLFLDYDVDLYFESSNENNAATVLHSYGSRFSEEVKYEITDLLIEAGFDFDKKTLISGKESTILEYLFMLQGDNSILSYLFTKGVGDYSIGEIPFKLLTGPEYSIEIKKKIIDTYPGYNVFVPVDVETGENKAIINVLDIILRYKRSDKEMQELINYTIDNYPMLKVTYFKYDTTFTSTYNQVDADTFIKMIKSNTHLMDKTVVLDAKRSQAMNLLYNFTFQDKAANSYGSDEEVTDLIRIIDCFVECGSDINKPMIYLNVEDLEWTRNSRSILVEIFYKMKRNGKINLEILECLHRNGFNPELNIGSSQDTPLIAFLRATDDFINEDVQKMIIEILEFFNNKKKLNIDVRNKFNDNLLMAYAKAGYYLAVEWLLEQGADVHFIGGFANNSVLNATIVTYDSILAIPRAKTVEVLIKYGAKIDGYENDMTPLMGAAYFGATECVRVLLEHGAKVNAITDEGMSALIYACKGNSSYDHQANVQGNKIRVVDLLLNHGADVNQVDDGTNGNALLMTMLNNQKEVFEQLISAGADIEIKEVRDGRTPLLLAIEHCDIYFVNRLFELGANVHAQSLYCGNTLHSAVFRKDKNEALELYNKYKELGVEPMELVYDEFPSNSLILASEQFKEHFVDILAQDFGVNSKDGRGNTALHGAIYSQHEDGYDAQMKTIEKLIAQGADVDATNKDKVTPLLWSAALGYQSIFEMLLEAGASLNYSIQMGEEIGMNEEIINRLKEYQSDNMNLV